MKNRTTPKKIDFYLLYEHWQREIYGLILLKLELEKRGYSVRIGCRTWMCETDPDRESYSPRVVVYPWIYTDLDVERALSFKGRVEHIVNMQCEQILSEFTMKNYVKIAEGYAKEAYHVCWGPLTESRFLDAGVERNKLRTIGNINLDINREQFSKVFESREAKAKRYGIDSKKRWIVYFSNFKFANGALLVDGKSENNKSIMEKRVRKETLRWFEQYLRKHEDAVIIYRPHPVEGRTEDSALLDLVSNFPNQFRVIADDVIQAWIKVADIFLTYISTSLVDVKYVGKPYALVRPEPVLRNEDGDIFCDAITIDSYYEMEDFLDGKISCQMISDDIFSNSVCNCIENTAAYVTLADWLVEILLKEPEKFRNVHYDDGASILHRIKRTLLFEKDGLTAKMMRRIRLKKIYQRVLNGENMAGYDGLANYYGTMPFSRFQEELERQRELEDKIRKLFQ